MTDEERMALEFFIACAPEAHPVIPGSGGFRKARWARPGSGKSGGARVIYFFIASSGQVYMASIYEKSRRASLSHADINILKRTAMAIKKNAKGEWS